MLEATALPTEPKPLPGCQLNLCVHSGDILQEAVRQLHPGVKVGKILIQRDEDSPDKTPVLFYKKLPRTIASCFVILMDPMLATAGTFGPGSLSFCLFVELACHLLVLDGFDQLLSFALSTLRAVRG